VSSPVGSLSGEELLQVVRQLLRRHPELRPEVEEIARRLLGHVNVDEVAAQVLRSLTGLRVESIAERTGFDGVGHLPASEAAYELLEEAVEPYLDDMARQHRQGLKDAAARTCLGIIEGLNRYEREAHEFGTQVPDGPGDLARTVLDEWTKGGRSRARWRDRAVLADEFPEDELEARVPDWAETLHRTLVRTKDRLPKA